MFKSIGLALGSSLLMGLSHKTANSATNEKLSTGRHAICIMYPHDNSGVKGIVSFSQENITAECKIVANLTGLKPNSLHGFHVHEFGDLSEGCTTAGPHFNPFNKRHGDRMSEDRHVGDLGNVKTDENGKA